MSEDVSNAQEMRNEFSAWMREFELGADEDARQRRWNGVVAVTSDATEADVEALVRIAFKSAVRNARPATAALEGIVTAFRDADPERPIDHTGREIEVMAAVCLAELIDDAHSPHLATITALAVCTASMCGARKPDLPMDLAGMADLGLRERSESNSTRPNLAQYLSGQVPAISTAEAAKQYLSSQSPEGLAAALKTMADATRNAMQTILANQQRALRDAAYFMAQQDDELQMLWWLTGERSFDFGCAFDAVPADARGLVLAKELAHCTRVLPGPPSIQGLLSRAEVRTGKISIPKAIIAVETAPSGAGWLAGLVEEEPSPVTLPIHLAIKRQLETGTGDSWVDAWAGATGIARGFACSQLTLAEHFYRERLLLSALRK